MPLHVKPKRGTFKAGLRRHVQAAPVYTGGPSGPSPSALLSGPVIYYNVLIDVYLFLAVILPEFLSDEQPGTTVSQGRKLPTTAFVCLAPGLSHLVRRDFPFGPTLTSDSGGGNGCL